MWSNGSNGKSPVGISVRLHMCIGTEVVYKTRPSYEILYRANGFYRPYL